MRIGDNIVKLAALTVVGVVGVTAVKQLGKLADKL